MNTQNALASYDVIIIGAGLSGLSCAHTLEKNNISYLLLESDTEVGGKVKTLKEPAGYTVDLGFQVLLNSYTEVKKIVDLRSLYLKAFNSGALILRPEKDELIANPLAHPKAILKTLKSEVFNLKDKILLLKLFIQSLQHKDYERPSHQTTHDFLAQTGFSKKSIDLFWNPFFSGVFLDKSLSLDSNYFLFLIRNFSLGSATIPTCGMAALPHLIAKAIPTEKIKCSSPVKNFSENLVHLKSGETLRARYIVKAYNETTANYKAATTYYFSTEDTLDWDKWLCLVSPEMNIKTNHLALLNKVASDYAPKNSHFISATTLGELTSSAEEIALEIQVLARKKLSLHHIKTTEIKKALPPLAHNNLSFIKNGHHYECGDHTSSPSIQGALKSGRKTAEDIIYNLK